MLLAILPQNVQQWNLLKNLAILLPLCLWAPLSFKRFLYFTYIYTRELWISDDIIIFWCWMVFADQTVALCAQLCTDSTQAQLSVFFSHGDNSSPKWGLLSTQKSRYFLCWCPILPQEEIYCQRPFWLRLSTEFFMVSDIFILCNGGNSHVCTTLGMFITACKCLQTNI